MTSLKQSDLSLSRHLRTQRCVAADGRLTWKLPNRRRKRKREARWKTCVGLVGGHGRSGVRPGPEVKVPPAVDPWGPGRVPLRQASGLCFSSVPLLSRFGDPSLSPEGLSSYGESKNNGLDYLRHVARMLNECVNLDLKL